MKKTHHRSTMRDPTYASFINQVVPYINPPVNYLSYSNWEIEEERERVRGCLLQRRRRGCLVWKPEQHKQSRLTPTYTALTPPPPKNQKPKTKQTPDELVDVLSAALTFIDCHVPAKPCVPGPRTFIGEYGYFLRAKNCSAMLAPQPVAGGGTAYVPTTPEIVAARSMWHCAAAVAWGSPLTLFWEVYSNEPGIDPATGLPCDRGYWLIDNAGAPAPVMEAHRAFFAAADQYIAEHSTTSDDGAAVPPPLDEFRRWAVAKLVELSGYGALGVAPPPVRPLGDIEAMAAAGLGGAW
jgi:hypothetical protein